MTAWTKEILYRRGDEYFDAVAEALSKAQRAIIVEMYIFANDPIGDRFCDILCEASRRGVQVKILIDAIGSNSWELAFGSKCKDAGVEYRIFHRLFSRHFTLLNKRTHRKLIIIDDKVAFIGSRNIVRVHSEMQCGSDAWFDLSLLITGEGLADLAQSFEFLWKRSAAHLIDRFSPFRSNGLHPELVRMNVSRLARRAHYKDLFIRLKNARHQIRVMTGYFVPPRVLVKSLCTAARNGVRVDIILPERSDVFFIAWLSRVFYAPLLDAGVQIYSYQPAMLHAKSLIIDDWMIIGTSNFNHRSIFHDIETDIVLTHEDTKRELISAYEEAISRSCTINEGDINSIWTLLGNFFLFFKFYL